MTGALRSCASTFVYKSSVKRRSFDSLTYNACAHTRNSISATSKPGVHDLRGLGWSAAGFVRLPPRVRFPARILASLASRPALHASPRPPSARMPSSRPMRLLPLHSHIAHARRHAAKDKREARRSAPTADSRPSAPYLAGSSRDSIEVSMLAKNKQCTSYVCFSSRFAPCSCISITAVCRASHDAS